MPLTLTNRPPLPGMPAAGEPVNMHNVVSRKVRIHGPPEIREKIDLELIKVEGLLRRFSSICITGTVRIVIVPDRMISYDGVLTAYHALTAPQRDALIREVDIEVTRFKYEFLPWLEQAEFEMVQTIQFESRQA